VRVEDVVVVQDGAFQPVEHVVRKHNVRLVQNKVGERGEG
jgi:hypothetical protein